VVHRMWWGEERVREREREREIEIEREARERATDLGGPDGIVNGDRLSTCHIRV